MTTFKRSFTDRDLSPIIGGEKREGGTGPIKKSHEVVISSRWRGGGPSRDRNTVAKKERDIFSAERCN